MRRQNRLAKLQISRKRRSKKTPPAVEELLKAKLRPGPLPHRPVLRQGEDSLVNAQLAQLSDPRLQTAQRQTLAAQIGRIQGNRHLQRVLNQVGQEEPMDDAVNRKPSQPAGENPSTPAAVSLSDIANLAGESRRTSVGHTLFAGTPASQEAPGGLGIILEKSGRTSFSTAAGLTRLKNSAAFKPPRFRVKTSTEGEDDKVKYFGEVQSTTSKDAVHESYYPGPGDHKMPYPDQEIDGKTYSHYWRVSGKISELIRKGEQEHLDDAARAYELTFKRVENEINTLANEKIGPAEDRDEVNNMAEEALAKRLPPQLGTHPDNWDKVLDELIQASTLRDKRGLHGITLDPSKTEKDRIIYPLGTTPTTKIGVPPEEIVQFPGAGGKAKTKKKQRRKRKKK